MLYYRPLATLTLQIHVYTVTSFIEGDRRERLLGLIHILPANADDHSSNAKYQACLYVDFESQILKNACPLRGLKIHVYTVTSVIIGVNGRQVCYGRRRTGNVDMTSLVNLLYEAMLYLPGVKSCTDSVLPREATLQLSQDCIKSVAAKDCTHFHVTNISTCRIYHIQ